MKTLDKIKEENKINYTRNIIDADGFEVITTTTVRDFTKEDFSFNNDESANISENSYDYQDELIINETNYHDDPFLSLSGKETEKKEIKSTTGKGIKIFTFSFITILVFWIGFLIYTGRTEEDQNFKKSKLRTSKSTDLQAADLITNNIQNNFKQETENSYQNNIPSGYNNYSTNQENKNSSQQVVNEMSLPNGVIRISNGYMDNNLNSIYILTSENKIAIQESSFGSPQGAEMRIQKLSKTGIFNGKRFEIQSVVSNGTNKYRILIYDYDTINSAAEVMSKVRGSGI